MNPINVAINISCLSSSQTRGFARYTTRLLKYLQKQPVNLYLFSYGEVCTKHLDGIHYQVLDEKVALNYFLWEQIYLAQKLKHYLIDLYHAPANYGVPIFARCSKVVTIHDIIDYKLHKKIHWKFRLLSYIARTFSQHIITVSNYSKEDIVDFFGLCGKKISVIYEAGEAQIKLSNDLKVVDDPYFFYLGGWDTRKNIPFLIDSFKKAGIKGHQLILAGEKDQKRRDEIACYIKQQSVANIILMEWVSEGELASLYHHAAAFIYPSLYEGFGLQLCEAMAYQIPILASNRTSLPEILDNQEALFSPTNTDQLASLMKRIAHDKPYRDRLKEHSIKRNPYFSWQKMAQETYNLYKDVISAR